MRMRRGTILSAAMAAALGGCAAIPSEPVRIVDSRADVAVCRSLGRLGPPVRTDGAPGSNGVVPVVDAGMIDRDFGARLQAMREAAYARGATDLLLVRRPYRDWSYVEGTAYRCRR